MRLLILGAAVLAGCAPNLFGQADATASAPLRITSFAMISGDFTGYELAKNLSVTAGADVEIRSFFTLFPALEVRGTYPLKGTLAREENILGGLRLARQSGPFHPYGDVLFGQGAVDYGAGGAVSPNGDFAYSRTISNVYSLGGGLEVRLNDRFAAKGDFQLQRYLTPVAPMGAFYAKVFSAGMVYRFGFGGRIR